MKPLSAERSQFTFAALLLWATLMTVLPAKSDDDPIGMREPGGPHHECGRNWSQKVSYRDLKANIEKWIGRCVIVTGMTRGYFFYADLPDYYQAQNLSKRISDTRGSKMGLYAESEAAGARLFGYRNQVEVVAMTYTCKHLREWVDRSIEREDRDDRRLHPNPPPDAMVTKRITFLTGYCHYTSDPVLFVSEFKVLDKGPVRLEGAAAAQAYGDLEPFSPTDENYSQIWAKLLTWFDALRRRDERALLKATLGARPDALTDKASLLYELLHDPDAGIGFLFNKATVPPMQIFRGKDRSNASESEFYFGCICKTGDCRNRWPIHNSDASMHVRWPYACIWMEKRGDKFEIGQ